MFTGTSISTSPTIACVAGAAISGGAGKAVKFNASGEVVLCSSAGEAGLGFLILQTADEVKKGDSVTVQIRGQGRVVAGGVIAAGDLLAVDANAKVVKATSGQYLIGQAMAAAAADGYALIDVIKGGKV